MGQPLQSFIFIVIMGDFNTPDVDWSTLSAGSEFLPSYVIYNF